MSIITPMYKGAAFVGETIQSVLNQTYTNWEMIIVDDCSPDGGAGIREVEKFDDPRIKLIKSKVNKGSSGARNIALHEAKGRYIAFLDSDDLWYTTYLEDQLLCMKEHDAPIVFASHRHIDEMTKEYIRTIIVPEKADYKSLLKDDPIFPSATVCDTEKIGIHYFDEAMGSMRDDYVYWLGIMRNGYISSGNKKVLVDYRVRKSSVTGNKMSVIKPQWNVYRKYLKMNIFESAYYFCCWAITGYRKYKNEHFEY